MPPTDYSLQLIEHKCELDHLPLINKIEHGVQLAIGAEPRAFSLCPPKDLDYYQVDVQAGQNYLIRILTPPGSALKDYTAEVCDIEWL